MNTTQTLYLLQEKQRKTRPFCIFYKKGVDL